MLLFTLHLYYFLRNSWDTETPQDTEHAAV